MTYEKLKAVVTGGLGFIGSNLAIRLVALGARVTVIDSSLAGCGANRFNLDPVRDRVHIVDADIGDESVLKHELPSADIVFNLAGEISHIHSMEHPERDLQVNTVAQLRFLLACQEYAPGIRVVYAGTRQVFGKPRYLPVDEAHPVQPVDFNGVHKYAATMYHLMLQRMGALDAIVLRLTNVYGPRISLNVPCQGFLSTFFRRLMLGQPLDVFGDGSQLRDPLFVDDAVEAFLTAGSVRLPAYRTYNVGGAEVLSLREIAAVASDAAGVDAPNVRPFPSERSKIDIGSYHTNSRRIELDLGWKPKVAFRDGIDQTLAFYREHLEHYLYPGDPDPKCPMPEHQVPHRLHYSVARDASR